LININIGINFKNIYIFVSHFLISFLFVNRTISFSFVYFYLLFIHDFYPFMSIYLFLNKLTLKSTKNIV